MPVGPSRCSITAKAARRFAAGHAAAAPVVVAACRYTSPRVISAHATRAILLASATATTFRGLRRSRARNHSVINLLPGLLAALITEVAPVTSRTRKRSLPSTDPAHPLLPAGRMFRWCQTGPGGEVTTGFKRRGIDLDRQRQRGDWAHAGDRGQALAHRVGFVRGGEFDLYFLDPGVEIRDLLAQQVGHVFGLGWDGGLLFNGGQQRANLGQPLAGDHAEFGGVAA